MNNRQRNVKCYMVGKMELIAEVESEDVNQIKLKNILAFNVRTVQNPNSPEDMQYSVQLIPPTMFADVDQSGLKHGILQRNAVIMEYDPNDDIYKQYCSTTSPIVLARNI